MTDITADVSRDDATEGAGVVLRTVGRVGLVAYGLVHLFVAALAVQVPFGDPERADKKGALQAVAATGPGLVLLWVVTGGLVAVALLLLRKRGRKSEIPFGPFLAGGAMVALLAGTPLVSWYLGL